MNMLSLRKARWRGLLKMLGLISIPQELGEQTQLCLTELSYGMLLLEIIGGRRNLDMSFNAEDFFYPGWAYKEMTNGSPIKVADRRLNGAVDEEELISALKVAFWCIQDEVFMRPTMGEVVKMLEGSININMPPMPQTVLELSEEGLEACIQSLTLEIGTVKSLSDMMKDEVCEMLGEFYLDAQLPKSFSSYLLTLVPKIEYP